MTKTRDNHVLPGVAISPEQRSHLIEDMAFFRAEQQRLVHGSGGDHDRCRREAQAALDAILRDMALQRWPTAP